MAEDSSNNKSDRGKAFDSLYRSITHTRPDPTTKAPILKRGSQSNDVSVLGNTSKETEKKP